ncbi:hypothetical protein SpCBS45565_g06235 [Spizellomyces sp. 'palustris']|nr:hypothetical protein SpCBS45565_g06235 [Spizellomyces sp. 'palustris']
MKSILRYYKR